MLIGEHSLPLTYMHLKQVYIQLQHASVCEGLCYTDIGENSAMFVVQHNTDIGIQDFVLVDADTNDVDLHALQALAEEMDKS